MENKKQSSIEYYKESIDYLFERYIESEIEEYELISRKDSIFKEVEEMHKQEIKESWVNGLLSDCLSEENEDLYAEDYYNQTFNSKEDDKV